MADSPSWQKKTVDRYSSFAIAFFLALAVFAFTWISIRQSRSDSYQLLVIQGKTFTESLAQACRNAISAQTYYDRLVKGQYSSLVSLLQEQYSDGADGDQLRMFARVHDLRGILIFDSAADVDEYVYVRPGMPVVSAFVGEAAAKILGSPDSNRVLLLAEGETSSDAVHYYLELNGQMNQVVVLIGDASTYSDAIRTTGIGYLVQNMAREQGIVSILYHTTEGIIFASRRPGDILSINSDLFLSEALDSDTISSRLVEIEGEKTLELVRPFSTGRYPFGLLRVKLSLEGYYSVVRGFDQQMITLSLILFVLTLTAMLYLDSRRKQQEISRQYSVMKVTTERIFEQMETGIAVVDSSDNIVMVNDSFRNLLGLRAQNLTKWNEVNAISAIDVNAFRDAQSNSEETELTRVVDGAEKHLIAVKSKILLDSSASAIVITIHDITRLREFERTAARKERLSEMGNLAAGVAHEIRNPLNTISIAAQRLALEFSPKEGEGEYRSFTQTIRDETKRLNEIITRFLTLAKEEKRNTQDVDIDQLIEALARLWRPELDRLGITLDSQLNADALVAGDPDRIKGVFANLFSNAKEALSGNKNGEIQIITKISNSMVLIEFSDNGQGIPPTLKEKVFTPYFTTKETGTGLGLPAVHSIVTELGGEIRLGKSKIGGATFVISLSQIKKKSSP
ncbi:MAG: ATP-binding protein [candidate division Zixibacteria bacterium]|nr:ATP-binding protein [candidate division Zixibacteria bacterium]